MCGTCRYARAREGEGARVCFALPPQLVSTVPVTAQRNGDALSVGTWSRPTVRVNDPGCSLWQPRLH